MVRTVPAVLGQRTARQLARILTPCGIRTQQLAKRNHGGVPFLRTVRI